MSRGRGRPRVTRRSLTAGVLASALLATAGGCGGGDDGPSERDYYRTVGSFCTEVTRAAKRVTTENRAVAKDSGASAKQRIARVAKSLDDFADTTAEALGALEKAGVPSRYADYQEGTVSGLRSFITALRTTAASAPKDPTVLNRLERRLKAIALPDPPADLTANAKACAQFSPAGG